MGQFSVLLSNKGPVIVFALYDRTSANMIESESDILLQPQGQQTVVQNFQYFFLFEYSLSRFSVVVLHI